MRYDYYFCIRYQPNLVKLLDDEEIKYKVSGKDEFFSNGTPVPMFVTFTIKGESPIVDRISMEFRRKPDISIVYSSAELNNAQLLWITPKKYSIEVTNEAKVVSYSCIRKVSDGTERVNHRAQTGLFSIAKEPAVKGQTAFWASSTGFSEVFTDRRVRNLAESNELKGVRFLDTVLRKGTHSDNIFQLVSDNVIDSNCIALGNGEKEISCPMCGKKQYTYDGTYQLHLYSNTINLTEDLYVTDRIFGTGIAHPLCLISQRFYQLLKQSKLLGSLYVDPVVFV